MITFIISDNDNKKTYNYELNDNIYKLKLDIIKDFNLKCEYIDLNITIERPIRVLGKYNMEPGIIPRTMDMYQFEKYGIDNKIITATFNEITDYKPYEKSRNSNTLIGRALNRESESIVESITYDLESNDDFPPLKV